MKKFIKRRCSTIGISYLVLHPMFIVRRSFAADLTSAPVRLAPTSVSEYKPPTIHHLQKQISDRGSRDVMELTTSAARRFRGLLVIIQQAQRGVHGKINGGCGALTPATNPESAVVISKCPPERAAGACSNNGGHMTKNTFYRLASGAGITTNAMLRAFDRVLDVAILQYWSSRFRGCQSPYKDWHVELMACLLSTEAVQKWIH
jgi:hypothetical protein